MNIFLFMLFNIVKILFNLCLLRGGPEDLPYSHVLLGLIVVASFIVSVSIGSIVHDTNISVLSSIAGLFFTFVFVKLLLIKKPERFLQTFCAILGTVTIINIFSLPSVYSLTYLELSETAKMFFSLTGFALFVWVVIVYGYIFSKALSSLMGYGLAISVGYALLSLMILEFIVAGSVTT